MQIFFTILDLGLSGSSEGKQALPGLYISELADAEKKNPDLKDVFDIARSMPGKR